MLTDEQEAEIRRLLYLAQQVRNSHMATALLVEGWITVLLDEIDALRAERDKLLLELVP